jgi:magnesium-transporting ATPase (P-type)
MPGVTDAEAGPVTGNVLLLFDPSATSPRVLFDQLRSLRLANGSPPSAPTFPAEPSPRANGGARVRIPVRGLDRDPDLGRRIVNRLKLKHSVRALAKPLTSHILVEFDHHRVLLEDILTEVTHLELPHLVEEDRPEHPLDPAPLIQGAARAVGSVIGLIVLTWRRLSAPAPAVSTGHNLTATAAGVMNLVQGIPVVRRTVQRFLGRHGGDLTSAGLGIVTLTAANFATGLIVAGVESLFLLGEVTARRGAWRRYEDRLDTVVSEEPGSVVRLETGMRVPLAARVIEGTGTAIGATGLPEPLVPGARVSAGAEVAGGPFVVELEGGAPFEPAPRPVPLPTTVYEKYLAVMGPVSVGFAALTALRTASLSRTFEALLLTNPRTAVIGHEAANLGCAARVLRAGLTVVGSRPERVVKQPTTVLLDGPRLLARGFEVAGVLPLGLADEDDILALVSVISTAAGSPWGNVFPPPPAAPATGGDYNGLWASATVEGSRYTLGPPEDEPSVPDTFLGRMEGGYLLELYSLSDEQPFGFVALRPRLAEGIAELVETARRLGVRLEMLAATGSVTAEEIGRRTGVTVTTTDDVVATVRARQKAGELVALVSDHADAAPAFAACDLAVGIAAGRGSHFPARADVLAPDLRAVADLLEAGRLRAVAVRDGVILSSVANGVGGVLGLTAGQLGSEVASLGVYITALGAMTAGWLRLRGADRPESSLAQLADPRPERWGRRTVADVLRTFNTTPDGLTSAEAATRHVPTVASSTGDELLVALQNQARTPITAVLAAGGCLTLALGQPLNTAIIAFTTALNLAAGVWQEREVGKASEALMKLGAAMARVVRDGELAVIPASDVVPGDILDLAPGDRVPADARIVSASGLEVDEASLTGESLPVVKGPDELSDTGRIVLEGSDVVVGRGRAVVVAVGRHTRLGATAAALSVDRGSLSPMGVRLSRILKIALPLAFAGGAAAGLAGLVYGGAAMQQLTLGVTTAISAIPEGLPLLAGVGQAGVARRLAARKALVRRIGAVEALGRVEVTCTDKTGTLTEGHLALRLVADDERETLVHGPLPAEMRHILLTAALASPHPDAPGTAHTTDIAVIRGARDAGLEDEMRAPRAAEVPFDAARAFHAARVNGRVCVKGAAERLIPRCVRVRGRSGERTLDGHGRTALLARCARLAEQGLRVLMVAEGPADAELINPEGLTALGFVGISDPLRAAVPEAMRRCLAAGVRVIMLTGDHPATAEAIAREAGLLDGQYRRVVRAAELADLSHDELDRRLRDVAVIARAAPLDKLRIVESLRRQGHTVAMTGDGVNDSPSLRLADVGVAMGRGTEVARQSADVVLTDDDFTALVESLVEGRGFWRNIRNALGLLLGGNAGELGLVVGASVLGFGSPLTTAEILIVNLITDAPPCLAVVLQRPQHRNLAGLAREGLEALDKGLRRDVFRRGVATAVPSLGAYLLTHSMAGPLQAGAVAFASVICTQLAQTLDVGRVEGTLSRSVVGAVGGSFGLLASSVHLPPLRNFLGLTAPSAFGWGMVALSSAAAVAISRLISAAGTFAPSAAAEPVPVLLALEGAN